MQGLDSRLRGNDRKGCMVRLRIILIAIIGLSSSFVSASFAAEPTKLLIAHGAISNNVEPLWIAKEQGIFRKYGIEAELVFIIAGRAMQAMLAGQVPVGLVGATHVVNANTGGGDFVMVLGLQNSLDYLFIARPNIKSAKSSKERKWRLALHPVRLRWRPMWHSII